MVFGKGIIRVRRGQTSLQTRFFLAFGVLLLIVVGCFTVYVNVVVIKPLKARSENEMQLAAAKISDQLDLYVSSQNELSQRILANTQVYTLLPRGGDSPPPLEGLTINRKLREVMFQAIGPSMNIEDMAIYDAQGSLLTSYIGNSGNLSSLVLFLEDSWKFPSWSESAYALYRPESGRVYFLRTIMNQNGQVFGYLSIQLKQEYLSRAAVGSAGSDVYVLDPDGQLVYGSSVLEDGEGEGEGEGNGKIPSFDKPKAEEGVYPGGRMTYVAYHRSAETGWTTYMVIPRKVVLGPVNSVKYLSMLLITSLILFSAAYLYVSARNLLLPIRKLRKQILRINYSNMDMKVETRSSNNELLMLNEAFRELLERLQVSIEREKQAVHEEAKARNSALQAQIAPHFIHNTLYLISIAAQEGKNEVVSDMCKHLSDSLRYIVSSPYEHVSLTQELEHARHYLTLVQHNFEEDLEWIVDADPVFDQIRLPRLVIQPFVENCIEHAFKSEDPPWRIEVRVKLYNGLWALEIRDNGTGFEADKIREILENVNAGCAQDGEQGTGLDSAGIGNMGIVNTVHRLKLMYKNRLFFNLYNHSEDGGGAAVQIIASLTEDFY
ncbi:sensor histidine kinase [Paenibacillus pinistramenti]|uniref:sensor histidine kinase n=1 Tax=Paenibacillus pinistramenti TaxID=1768003 RepID=UPI001EEFAF01|nr:sensor histidine kinase [Paenibacillus pinistramenti]